MDTSFVRNHPAVTALLWAIPVVAILLLVGSRIHDEGGHAASHFAIGLPALASLFSSRRWREPVPGRLGSAARRLLLVGLALLGAGQTFEAIGAFGFDGYARQYEWAATVHDLAMFSGPPGLLLLLIGGLLTAVTRMNERTERSGRLALLVIGAAVMGAFLLRFAVLGA